eukprot:NODE_571_length_1955_cov_8.636411_g458_i0.p9 GENE.NODE_571_length_1955_cov_8.636411_g458_i0~~NODE_571_length_1955_cov_8.636411_g458_i0.p9  ORF type:complete len:72 (-),score=11.45 NODE_571_length_1955_cov_8.636411_g458_i0:120-335(-)
MMKTKRNKNKTKEQKRSRAFAGRGKRTSSRVSFHSPLMFLKPSMFQNLPSIRSCGRITKICILDPAKKTKM